MNVYLQLSTTTPSLAYTIPVSLHFFLVPIYLIPYKSNQDTKQSVIFAFGTNDPGSSAADATLIQHLDYGILSLDLTKSISSDNSSSPTGGSSSGSGSIPLQPYQKLIVGHAVLCVFGFLFLLPAGALFARYARTFMSSWFQGHWALQFAIG